MNRHGGCPPHAKDEERESLSGPAFADSVLRRIPLAAACFLSAVFVGCSGNNAATTATAEAPAHVETTTVDEADLTTVTLTAQAVERLGIQTAVAESKAVGALYTVAGEVMVPPGNDLVVQAPVTGIVNAPDPVPPVGASLNRKQVLFRIVPLLPVQRDLGVNARAEVEAAETRLDAAGARAERAARLVRDGVGSVRAQEDAEEAVRLAETQVDAARRRLAQLEQAPVDADVAIPVPSPQDGVLSRLHVAEGQAVSSGTTLFEVRRMDPLWIRVPVYSGDLARLVTSARVKVRPINADTSTQGSEAAPVEAPPSADPASSTSDLYYRIGNTGQRLRPGERVSVSIPEREQTVCLQVPFAAILYDMNGGSWVYEQVEPRVFTRHRVTVANVVDSTACLASGIPEGTAVVTDGAMELFGTEFGVAH